MYLEYVATVVAFCAESILEAVMRITSSTSTHVHSSQLVQSLSVRHTRWLDGCFISEVHIQ